MKHEHEWQQVEVKLAQRKKGALTRPGYVCATCRLVAMPPKNKPQGWRPPK